MKDTDEAGVARRALEERYGQLGLVSAELVTNHRGTIVEAVYEEMVHAATFESAPGDPAADSARAAQADEAAVVARPGTGSSASDQAVVASLAELDPTRIEIGEVVGVGGMGIVNVGSQAALRREVAVKRVKPEKNSPGAVSSLLREAWVTGALEHPNVVPVHLLLASEDGTPQVVMKRIEGVTWEALLASPDLVAELEGRGGDEPQSGRDLLAFHLRILIDVCHAVHFAHTRGVLHLDLKPDNVMVGRFGEVYLVDWGIAAALPDGPAWLPRATSIKRVRGTPSWMPPEMAMAEGERIDQRSDVYLLGGLLHAILTDGKPRHAAGETLDILTRACLSLPQVYPASVPKELGQLANRATWRRPEERPPSAEAFRRAVEDFLEHRHSNEIAARASATMNGLIKFFASNKTVPAESTQAGQELRRKFLECRFGFRQALEIWPGNQQAKDGLQEVLRAMARYALDHEQLERAAESVAELSPRDPALDAEVKALAGTLAERHERLLTLERDASIEAFRERRSLLSLGAGVLFIVWNVIVGWLHRSGTFRFELVDLLWLNGLTFAVFVMVALSIRKTLLTTATNRRVVVLFGTGFIAVLAFWVAMWLHASVHPERALSALEVVSLSCWAYPFFVLAIAFTTDFRAMWIALPVTVLAMVAPLAEDLAFEMLGLGGFICGVWLAFIWRSASRRAPRPAIRPD